MSTILYPVSKGIIGFGLGLYIHKIYSPITVKILNIVLNNRPPSPDPFGGRNFLVKLILAPLICVIIPIVEEKYFRGQLNDLVIEMDLKMRPDPSVNFSL